MKRSFTTLLLTAMLLPTGTVLAAEQGNATAAVEQAAVIPEVAPIPPAIQKTMTKLFELQPAFKQLHIHSGAPDETNKTFSVFLTDTPTDETSLKEHPISSSGNLTFDMKTGELLSFSIQMKEWTSEKLPTTRLAKEKAEQFLISWLGAEERKQFGTPTSRSSGSITYDSDQKPITWSYRYAEFPVILNNIPVSGFNFVQIKVDSAGRIVGGEFNVPNLKNISTPAIAVRAADDMKKQLITADSLMLQYVEKQPERYGNYLKEIQEAKPALRYDLNVYGPFNAQTGKPIHGMTGEELKQNSGSAVPWKVVQIKPQGNKLIAHSEQEAAEVLGNLFNFDFSQMQLQKHDGSTFTSRESSPYSHYFWSDQKGSGINVNIDQTSGLITDASLDINQENNRPATVSKEEAFATALTFIEKYAGPTAKELEVQYHTFEREQPPAWVDKEKAPTFSENEQQKHYFWFQERYEGIPVMGRSYSVTVDAATGKITNFSLAPYQEKLSLPAPEGIVSKEKAAESFLQNNKLKLEYLWPSYFDQPGPAPILTYTWERSGNTDDYVDAFTGNYVRIPIEPYDEE
ncbi:YcdB/YcdC domain-containing protein [Aneurinibacillus uraniidurans]|uniref:YcdB/YcdC domain-containing protein n=1 Tax=Aneurinibacillus uraniidurans TaxID=2966586 RepID=UPI00234BC7FD|nr:YcdB/YcdC domain-containing protein [Aneurinibacillus sp. B1]WCN38430.1 hypothetical protein PO771_03260 [Aneurinibacillus sp. B1]